ncbi:MAG: 3-hydroxyacyl-CoA dehydrogenase family protein [Gammaproteobacteria bacterium]
MTAAANNVAISAVSVLGAGQMGRGIAQVCTAAGLQVQLYDNNQTQLTNAADAIRHNLRRMREKDKISEQQFATLPPVVVQGDIGEWLRASDIVIEAIAEDADAKKNLYHLAGKHLRDDAILASNTSSFSIGELASAAPRPQLFAGMHFMNPAPLMRLVEVIPALQTAAQTTEKITMLARVLGKETIQSADSPGFITNRLLMPLINEAIYARHENLGSAEDIDRAMRLGMNHPMGPLTLADFIGLDTVLAVLEVLRRGFGDAKFRPCPLLHNYVAAGWLGKKTGRGFYCYE